MAALAHVVKQTIPNYLSNLPIPDTIGGWFKLGARDWIALVPLGASLAGLTWLTYQVFCPAAYRKHLAKPKVNPSIKKDIPKVVDAFQIEELGDKVAFCRCWRSARFPYCDGAHGNHNRETGDNVGPIVLNRKGH